MMLRKIIFLTCWFSCGAIAFGTNFWNDLPALKKNVLLYPELANPDQNACFNVTFNDHYKKISAYYWYSNIMHVFNQLIGRHVQTIDWPAQDFAQLLEQASILQKKQKDATREITPQPATTIIVIGPLHGAIHSLARIFSHLESINLMYKDLSLKQQCYLVFLGNSINQSPYSLDTLAIIAKLIVQNPGHVMLLKGPHEANSSWHYNSLGRELATKVPVKNVPVIEKMLDGFFSSLNTMLKLHYINRHTIPSSVLLSCSGYDALKLPLTPTITTQIKGDLFDIMYRISNGLRYAEAERGVTTWALLSCPVSLYQSCYHYTNDSFAILTATKQYNDWLLTHYTRNTKTDTPFEKYYYNAMTGQQYSETQAQELINSNQKPLAPVNSAALDQGNEIVIGSLLSLTRNIRDLGNLTRKGLTLCFNRENHEHGGINHKFIRLIALDNEYSDAQTRILAPVLLNTFKTTLCLVSIGTTSSFTMGNFATEHNMLLLFPYTGGDMIRTAKIPGIINLRTSYANEAIALVDYAVQTLKKKKLAIFYQDDSFGYASRDAALARLKNSYQIQQVVTASYPTNTIKVAQAVEKIKSYFPEAIFFFAVQQSAEEFIRLYGLHELANISLLGISPLTEAFKKNLQDLGLRLFMSRVVPNPVHSDLPIAKEFRETLTKYAPDEPINDTIFEAYINAQFLLDTLKNIAEPFTIDKLANYLTGIQRVNYKGLSLNFDPKTRTLMHNVWLDDGNTWHQISVT